MLNVDFVLELELAEDLDGLEDAGGVVDLQLLVSESEREMHFGAAARFEILEETLLVFVVSDHVLGSGDAHLPAERVAGGVESGALLALGRTRASRVLSILPIGIELSFSK